MASTERHDDKWKKWTIETLPIIPEKYIYQVSKNTKKQYEILKKLLNDKYIDIVINACDTGREGELIFRLVYNQARLCPYCVLHQVLELAVGDEYIRFNPSDNALKELKGAYRN